MKIASNARMALAALCLLALPSAGIAAQADTPEGFLRHLYAQYAPGHKQIAFDYPDAAAIVDASLLDALHHDQIAAKGEVGALDYDPICQCQDWEALKTTALTVRPAGPDHATASVTFDNGTGSAKWTQTVRYDLVRVAGAWKIHDIGSKDAASLQGLLRSAKY
jgi:hypothetical protein